MLKSWRNPTPLQISHGVPHHPCWTSSLDEFSQGRLKPGKQSCPMEFLQLLLDKLGALFGNPRCKWMQRCFAVDHALNIFCPSCNLPLRGEAMERTRELVSSYEVPRIGSIRRLTPSEVLDTLITSKEKNINVGDTQEDQQRYSKEYHCNHCRTDNVRYNCSRLLGSKQPQCLILALKRNTFNGKKQADHTPFPFEYSTKSVSEPGCGQDYFLHAVVVHVGGSTSAGHCIAFIRQEEAWWCIDGTTATIWNPI